MPRAGPSDTNIRLLLLGHTGAGKTGSLASLVAAGYDVRDLDLDNGAEILSGPSGYILNPNSPYRKSRDGLWDQQQADTIQDRFSFVTVAERYTIQGAKAVPRGDAWQRANSLLNDWRDGDLHFGNIAKWPRGTILVIDSFSRYCEAAMNFQLAMNGRLLTGPQVGTSGSNDYTHAYRMIEDQLNLFKAEEIKCDVIFIAHIRFMEEPGANPSSDRRGVLRGFPQTIGPMLSPKVGQYFNHTLRVKQTGTGPATRRVIVTENDENIELKNPAPLRVKREYKLETGLAEYWRDIRGDLS